MSRRRWLLLTAAIVLSIGVGLSIKSLFARRAPRERQTQYAAIVRDYSEVLKPGKSRREVEAYLQLGHHPIRQMCCLGVHRSAYADIVKIGQEQPPWYCNNYNMYVGFEFDSTDAQGSVLEARDSDKLQDVILFPWLEECL
jgi:hypothetical protein